MKASFTMISSIGLLALMATSHSAVITFDEVIAGETSYAYDGDADGTNDVIFSTVDTNGFNTVGPGTNMNYIDEPGIEGTTLLPVDLRVDFLYGATSNLTFGFALSTSQQVYGVTFEVYDQDDNLLASTYQVATYAYATVYSDFPEAQLSLDFAGTAAYALFKFDAEPTRYIIDNFEGAFGSRPENQSAMIADFQITPTGVIINWIPVMGLHAEIKWTPDLGHVPFTSIAGVLPYPRNSYTDTVHNAESQGFYHVDLVY